MDMVCSGCTALMVCAPGQNCWCADLPHALPVVTGVGLNHFLSA
jgi:hypothetical protein